MITPSCFDDDLRLDKRDEPMHIQTFVREFVRRPKEVIFARLAGTAEVELHVVLIGPILKPPDWNPVR